MATQLPPMKEFVSWLAHPGTTKESNNHNNHNTDYPGQDATAFFGPTDHRHRPVDPFLQEREKTAETVTCEGGNESFSADRRLSVNFLLNEDSMRSKVEPSLPSLTVPAYSEYPQQQSINPDYAPSAQQPPIHRMWYRETISIYASSSSTTTNPPSHEQRAQQDSLRDAEQALLSLRAVSSDRGSSSESSSSQDEEDEEENEMKIQREGRRLSFPPLLGAPSLSAVGMPMPQYGSLRGCNLALPTLNGRKTRRRLTNEELVVLESVFATNPTPDSFTKHRLAQMLYMSPQQVSNWFQNRRSRVRREKKKAQQRNPKQENTSTDGKKLR